MKKIGLLLFIVILLSACSSNGSEPVAPEETVTEPTRVQVSNDAYLINLDGKVSIVQDGESSLVDLEKVSLGSSEPYFVPIMQLKDGFVYRDADQLMHQLNGQATVLLENINQVEPVYEGLLVTQQDNDQFVLLTNDGSIIQISELKDQNPADLIVVNQGTFLVENKTTSGLFVITDLIDQEESVEINGQALVAIPDKDAVLFVSDEHPGKLGQLDLATGDTTWYELGENRTTILYDPILIDNDNLLTVFDNQGQAELVVFNINDQVLQSTNLGPAGDFVDISQTETNLLIHTRTRIYRSDFETMDYFEFEADKVIESPQSLLLIQNNNVRVIKNDSYKDYQFPGRVADVQLSGQSLVVLYAGPEGRTMAIQSIDF